MEVEALGSVVSVAIYMPVMSAYSDSESEEASEETFDEA